MSQINKNSDFLSKNKKKIVTLQNFFKKNINGFRTKDYFLKKYRYIEKNLIDMSQHCKSLLDRDYILSEEYYNYMTNLEEITINYNNLISSLKKEKVYYLEKVFFRNYVKKIIELKSKLFYISSYIGCSKILHIFNLYYDISKEESIKILENNKIDHILFYNDIFIPRSVSVYFKEKNSFKNTLSKNKSILILTTENKNDISNLEKLKENISLQVKDHNTVLLYICVVKDNDKLYFCIKGDVKPDHFNVYHNHPLIKNNINILKTSLVDKENSFYQNYIDQIPLRELIINDVFYIKNKILESLNKLKILKQKNISSLVKDFLNSNLESQIETLTLFLINENDHESEYLAYLLYDILSNESDSKTKRNEHEIFGNLHWSIQKRFKISINNIKKREEKIKNFNEDDISYEKKIMLMKVGDYVKQKALDKYKEVVSKSSPDSSNKAQQYLDGILKIPFGIIKKEKVIEYLNNFSLKVEVFNSSLQKIKVSKKDPVMVDFLNQNKNSIDLNTVFRINEYLEQYSFSYFKKKFRVDMRKLFNQIDNINYVNIKSLIKKLREKDISSPTSFTIKVTNKNKPNKLETLRKEIKVYLNSIVKLCINDKISQELLKKIIYLIDSSCYYSLECNSEYSMIHDKYRDLITDWTNFNYQKDAFLENVSSSLDKAIYGHQESKNQIKRIIAQWITGENTGYSFGFEGPPGTGKTSIAKKGLTKCLKDDKGVSRPFSFIAMGGSTNGSTLEGHSYTYVGSTWGRIVDILMESKCMNPIIYIDELDKISKTEHGKELIGILTHLTDSTQNQEFNDKYFSGIKIDLSKVLFIFSYNNPENIDPILLDRIHRVKFKPLKKQEKIHICRNYMIPEIFKMIGIDKDSIIINDNIIEKIIDQYTYEAGVRKLRERLIEIIRELNLRYLTKKTFQDENVVFPFKLTMDHLENDIFKQRIKVVAKKILSTPKVGLVNGLYATSTGLGGITIIEAYRIHSSNFLSLELTGQQGDVMKESMKVAKTVAWSCINLTEQIRIRRDDNISGNNGVHIHCPEGATPKDGPSAGLAITTAIISLLLQIPVNNKIGMTGEIDLNGSAHQIGGLESKLFGAKKAGIEHVLIPRENEKDLIFIKNDDLNKDLFNNFRVTLVDNIWDVLKQSLIGYKEDMFIDYTNTTKLDRSCKFMINDNKVKIGLSDEKENKKFTNIQWTQIGGLESAVIEKENSSTTYINNLEPGVYIFTVSCNYNLKNSKESQSVMEFKREIEITVYQDPIINEQPSVNIYDTSYLLNCDNQILNLTNINLFTWKLIKKPDNDESIIENPHSVRTIVSNLTIGNYVFQMNLETKDNKKYKSLLKLNVLSKNAPRVKIID